jgi:hypothetical protein
MDDRMFLGNAYQANVVRTDLTRALPVIVPELVDESALALPEALHIPEGSGTMPTCCWLTSILTIICRLDHNSSLPHDDRPCGAYK